jgi:hypothetical protein
MGMIVVCTVLLVFGAGITLYSEDGWMDAAACGNYPCCRLLFCGRFLGRSDEAGLDVRIRAER